MQLAHQILVLFHLIGLAALLGGFLVQIRSKEPEINASMLNGSFTASDHRARAGRIGGGWAGSG
jgi:hypothetical protein